MIEETSTVIMLNPDGSWYRVKVKKEENENDRKTER